MNSLLKTLRIYLHHTVLWGSILSHCYVLMYLSGLHHIPYSFLIGWCLFLLFIVYFMSHDIQNEINRNRTGGADAVIPFWPFPAITGDQFVQFMRDVRNCPQALRYYILTITRACYFVLPFALIVSLDVTLLTLLALVSSTGLGVSYQKLYGND